MNAENLRERDFENGIVDAAVQVVSAVSSWDSLKDPSGPLRHPYERAARGELQPGDGAKLVSTISRKGKTKAKHRTLSHSEDEDEEEDKDEDEDENGEILLDPDADVFEFHVGYHGEQCPETATFQVADERLPRCLECGKFIKAAAGKVACPQQTSEASQLAEAAPAPPAAAPQQPQGSGHSMGEALPSRTTMTVGSMTFSASSSSNVVHVGGIINERSIEELARLFEPTPSPLGRLS